MTIREATAQDIPILVDFRKRQLIDEGQEETVDIIESLTTYFTKIMNDKSNITWLVFVENVPIAAGSVLFLQNPPSFKNPTGHYGYIHSIFTESTFRGKGIATNLVTMAINATKARGYNVARLQASEHGLSLYQKLGFVLQNDHMILRF